ncbi:hypothetical protein GCM10007978_45180 [Shewanella hanedai]|nr:hypothetical protein GCM10007978_45180 [Shewanella hanedai]
MAPEASKIQIAKRFTFIKLSKIINRVGALAEVSLAKICDGKYQFTTFSAYSKLTKNDPQR